MSHRANTNLFHYLQVQVTSEKERWRPNGDAVENTFWFYRSDEQHLEQRPVVNKDELGEALHHYNMHKQPDLISKTTFELSILVVSCICTELREQRSTITLWSEIGDFVTRVEDVLHGTVTKGFY